MAEIRCIDCLAENANGGRNGPRPTPFGGPRSLRCATHGRAKGATSKKTQHEAYVQRVYGLEAGEYDAIYEFQGGRCAGCGRATGVKKRLAVDHHHASGFVRMEVCSVCNRFVGHLRDDPATLRRLAANLEDPPAIRAVGWRRGQGQGDGRIPEIWRDVPQYGGWYQCSTHGRVRSWKTLKTMASGERMRLSEARILAPGETRGGYLIVGLSAAGSVKSFRMNRLVLLTFVGSPDHPDAQACHRDGDRRNNRLDNLYWGSPKENAADKVFHGTQVVGEQTNGSKLTERDVLEIRRCWATGDWAVQALAERYGVSGPTVWKAATGKTWRYLNERKEETNG